MTLPISVLIRERYKREEQPLAIDRRVHQRLKAMAISRRITLKALVAELSADLHSNSRRITLTEQDRYTLEVLSRRLKTDQQILLDRLVHHVLQLPEPDMYRLLLPNPGGR